LEDAVLLMILSERAEYAKSTLQRARKMMEEYGAFTQSIVQSAIFKGGRPAAAGPHTATTAARPRTARTLTTDGPFAETREQLGGYYLVRQGIFDAALCLAARIPGARFGSSRSGRSGSNNLTAIAVIRASRSR